VAIFLKMLTEQGLLRMFEHSETAMVDNFHKQFWYGLCLVKNKE
jgi:hypothetical protein